MVALSTCDLQGRAEQIILRNGAALAHLTGKRGASAASICAQQPAGQHRQRVARIDNLGRRLAKEIGTLVGLGHRKNSQESVSDSTNLGGLGTTKHRRKPSVHAEWRGLVGPTM
jgi:hypothetical protein